MYLVRAVYRNYSKKGYMIKRTMNNCNTVAGEGRRTRSGQERCLVAIMNSVEDTSIIFRRIHF